MPRFVFRLQVPLRLARAQRNGLRKEIATAMRLRDEAERALLAGEQHLERIGTELVERSRIGIAGDELAAFSQGRDAARARLPRLRDQVTVAVAEEERVRTELAQASREVTVLEKLRAEAFAEWLRELQRKEQAMIDDVLLVRRVRTMAGVPGAMAGAGR